MATRPADYRNLVLCGHGSAGKTTLVDRMLAESGAVKGSPSVDAGTSVCDFEEEEKHHKHSIESKVVHCERQGKTLQLIDTPGYPELAGQMIAAFRAAETALIVIDAHAGIKVNARRAWDEAGRAGCGRMIAIAKLDSENIDFGRLLESIQAAFGPGCAAVNVPLGIGDSLRGVASTLELPPDLDGAPVDARELHERLVEAIIESDEAVLERYFEGEVPSPAELRRLLVEAVAAGTLAPILCVSAKRDVGVRELLDFIASAALPPAAVARTAVRDGATVELLADPDGPLAAQVFKTRIDPFVQKLSFIRVYSGVLKKDAVVASPQLRKGVKLGSLLAVQASETRAVDDAGPGSIVAVTKCEELHTGMSLGDAALPPILFPQPMVGLAVAPKNRGDEAKLSGALHKIAEEDSTVRIDHDPETKEMVLTGMSELHLKLLRERIKRRDHVEIETHEPKIPYRETIQTSGEGSYRHKKQSGGAGQFGEVHIRMYPLPAGVDVDQYATKQRFPQLKSVHFHRDSNFLWIDSVVGGSIPGNFMPAIEKGFLERVKKGVVAGFPIQNVCVEVHFGKDHPVDSNETAFRIAASKAFAQVFKECRPGLLEPFVNLHVTVPSGNVGDVSSDLAGRRGQMIGMEAAGGDMTTVEARAPLAEVANYARTLSSMTGGQGSYAMELSHYDVVPGNVQQEILSKAKLREDED
jgi:elongation factor G